MSSDFRPDMAVEPNCRWPLLTRRPIKKITHTNDLTSLALTSSTLYNLAIPHIYARFDIVWPDAHTSAAEGKSVDALTYGLSTLCLGSTFAKTTHRLRRQAPGGQSLVRGNPATLIDM